MEQTLIWNLQELFASSEEFYAEITKINEELVSISSHKDDTLDAETLLLVLNLKWTVKERANAVLIYGSLNYYKDIESEDTKKMKEVAEQLVAKVDSTLAFIDEKIIELGLEKINEYLSLNDGLQVYEFYLNNIFRLRSHIQGSKKSKEIEQLKNSINEKITIYNTTCREIDLGVITVDGEEVKLTASTIAKYLSSRNRDTRMQAYLAVNRAFKEKKSIFAQILNNIYRSRVKISELEGYATVGEKALFEENINPEVLDALIHSVQSNTVLLEKYLKLKTNALAIDDPHLYDYSVPFDSDNKKKYTLEDAIEIIRHALAPLGEKYLEIIDLLLSNNHIDAALDGKKHQSITFSWSTYSFMNYREAYVDLKNLAHELGHLVNAYLSNQSQPYIYEDSSVFVGETASLVNEILLNRYLSQNTQSEEEQLFYLSTSIENSFTQIFRQTMYTEFETILYQLAKSNIELSPELLGQEYLNLLQKYYGKTTTYDDCSDIEWARLGQLFRWNYYVYKYATGLIIANSVVQSIVDNKTISIDDYLKFLSSGSNDYSIELLLKLNINPMDEAVVNDSFQILESDIEKLDKLLSRK